MRVPGLAHGWEGRAWVSLQRARPPTDALARQLAGALRGAHGPAMFIGRGGAATVAVLAAARDRRFASLARAHVSAWASSGDGERDDVYLGHPGALLAMGELAAVGFVPPRAFLRRCHARTLASLRRMLRADDPVLGVAHGIAGLLLALESASARFGVRRDTDVLARGFARLASARMIAPGVVLWPNTAATLDVRHGWCAGGPGIALAMHRCHVLSGERHYRELHDLAVPSIAAIPSANRTTCCGRAGRAHVLVELYRGTRDPRLLVEARRVAAEPVAAGYTRGGLMQGVAGERYLAARLANPELPFPGTG